MHLVVWNGTTVAIVGEGRGPQDPVATLATSDRMGPASRIFWGIRRVESKMPRQITARALSVLLSFGRY